MNAVFSKILIVVLAVSFAPAAVAQKKDFKGMFGSFQRERFTENEARDTAFGMDLLLSTLLPLGPLVKSIESTGGPENNLYYSTFFNVETAFHVSFSYRYVAYLSLGFFSYQTRKQNALPDTQNLPLFHEFELDAYPIVLGGKYRFSQSDIVPYIGAGAGIAYVRRKGGHDHKATVFDERRSTNLVVHGQVGLEFFIAANAGIRLEASAMMMKLDPFTYVGGSQLPVTPTLVYQKDPLFVRYASGIFLLF